MVFSSSAFLFLFLPVFLSVYFLAGDRHRSIVILAGSYLFYAWWRVDFLLLFIGVTAWNWLLGIRVARERQRGGSRRWVTVGISGDLLILAYFKYANFGVDSLNLILQNLDIHPFSMAEVILPIGISFYVFQAISYLVDVHRGDTPPTARFIDFAAFIALFPQLIAGPVLRYKDMAGQFACRTHTRAKFAEGANRFMQGFIKKVFIADTLAPIADAVFGSPAPSMADSWLAALTYTIQLYFDFSGYSDMAIGLGLMMGFRFIENFDQPYISQSITEFWRRWHISLSSWLRDYLYIPLGGSRGRRWLTYRNLLLTMLLGGLWHGANWTFILWGLWHGLWLALERIMGLPADDRFRPLRWLACMLLVLLGWVLFRADSLTQAGRLYLAMLGAGSTPLSVDVALQFGALQLLTLMTALVIIAVQSLKIRLFQVGRLLAYRQGATLALLIQVPLFFLSIGKLIASHYSPFLYFQF